MAKMDTVFSKVVKVAFMHFVVCSILFIPLSLSFCLFPTKGNLGSVYSPIDQLVGTWVEIQKVGFDEILLALNQTKPLKHIIPGAKSVLTYSRLGSIWNLRLELQGRPGVINHSYRIGKQYLTRNFDGRPIMHLVTQTPTFQHEVSTSTKGNYYMMFINRHIYLDHLIIVLTVGQTSMMVIYKRVNKPC